VVRFENQEGLVGPNHRAEMDADSQKQKQLTEKEEEISGAPEC
jgi:hypothetical protein